MLTMLAPSINTNYLTIISMTDNTTIGIGMASVETLACGCKLNNYGELEKSCIQHLEANFMK